MLRTPSNRDEMFVDVGMYGVPSQERYDPLKSLRRLEEFVRNIGGFQMMYAESSMTRDEFRAMFDHTLYDRFVYFKNLDILFQSHFLGSLKSWDAKGIFRRFMTRSIRELRQVTISLIIFSVEILPISGPFKDFQNRMKKKFERKVD